MEEIKTDLLTKHQKELLNAYNYMAKINIDITHSFHSLPLEMQDQVKIQKLYRRTADNIINIINTILPTSNVKSELNK